MSDTSALAWSALGLQEVDLGSGADLGERADLLDVFGLVRERLARDGDRVARRPRREEVAFRIARSVVRPVDRSVFLLGVGGGPGGRAPVPGLAEVPDQLVRRDAAVKKLKVSNDVGSRRRREVGRRPAGARREVRRSSGCSRAVMLTCGQQRGPGLVDARVARPRCSAAPDGAGAGASVRSRSAVVERQLGRQRRRRRGAAGARRQARQDGDASTTRSGATSVRASLVPQRVDRIEARRLAGRVEPEPDPDDAPRSRRRS